MLSYSYRLQLSQTQTKVFVLLASGLTAVLFLVLDLSTCAFGQNSTVKLVPLTDFAPGVHLDMRYFGEHNFLGRRVRGYKDPTCLLTTQAAKALAKVQYRAEQQGYALKIYDCYRPQKAVDDFVTWAKDPSDIKMKTEFYPNTSKHRLFEFGYIAEKSGHSRGSTVDVTLIKVPATNQENYDALTPLVNCAKPSDLRFGDHSLDMGSGYDCFDEISHTETKRINKSQRKNRHLLKSLMEQGGFVNYEKEWWHYTLKDEPNKDAYLDQDVIYPYAQQLKRDYFGKPLHRTYTSPVIESEAPMDQAVLFWNVNETNQSHAEFQLRFASTSTSWSNWFTMATVQQSKYSSLAGQKAESAHVDVDTLMLKSPASLWQYRIKVVREGGLKIHSVGLALKNAHSYQPTLADSSRATKILDIPALSQYENGLGQDGSTDLQARICSPTSVAMVALDQEIAVASLYEFSKQAYDAGSDMFGNWPINTQLLFKSLNAGSASSQYLVYPRWLNTLDQVLDLVDESYPVPVSIQYKQGELDGAPKPTTGHFLIVRGADDHFVYVNDPASPDQAHVARKYPKQQFVKAWKGIAYVIENRSASLRDK